MFDMRRFQATLLRNCRLLAIFVLLCGAPRAVVTAADESTAPPTAIAEPIAKAGLDIDGDALPAGVVARLGTKRFRANRTPVAVSFIQGGNTLALTTKDGWLQHWDAASGRFLRERQFSEHPVAATAAAPDIGQRTIAVRGFYLDEGRRRAISWIGLVSQFLSLPIAKVEVEDQDELFPLALSPDGATIACAGNRLHVINVRNGTEITPPHGVLEDGSVNSLAFSPDGNTLAIGTGHKVLLWNWKTQQELRSIPIAANTKALSFSPDGIKLAIGNQIMAEDGVCLIDLTNVDKARSFGVSGVKYWCAYTLAFSPDGKMLAAPIDATNSGGGIALWDTRTGNLVHRLGGLYDNPDCLAFSPDGGRLAATNSDAMMAVWDIATGKLVGGESIGHIHPAATLRFLSDDRQLASAGDDGTIRIWNLADSRQVRSIQIDGGGRSSASWIRGMDVSPDGKYIASSTLDDSVRLWDTATGREVYRLPGHGQSGG